MSMRIKNDEALRLADALRAAINQTDAEDDVIHVARWFMEDSETELRRLYNVNQHLLTACETLVTLPGTENWISTLKLAVDQARAAINIANNT